MKKTINLSPIVVRTLLIVVIVLIIAANFVVFYLGSNMIRSNGQSITELVNKLSEKQQEITKIEAVKVQMRELDDVKTIINKIFIDKTDKNHQNIIIDTLHKHTSKVGLSIRDISFTQPTKGDTSGGISTAITFNQKIAYRDALRFIKLTENSLPQIQITDLTLNKDGQEGDDVTISNVKIKFYVK